MTSRVTFEFPFKKNPAPPLVSFCSLWQDARSNVLFETCRVKSHKRASLSELPPFTPKKTPSITESELKMIGTAKGAESFGKDTLAILFILSTSQYTMSFCSSRKTRCWSDHRYPRKRLWQLFTWFYGFLSKQSAITSTLHCGFFSWWKRRLCFSRVALSRSWSFDSLQRPTTVLARI